MHGAKTKNASQSKVALYHYLLKSEGEYRQKMARGSGAGNFKGFDFFTSVDKQAGGVCTHGVQLGLQCCPSVREALGVEGVERVMAALAGVGVAAVPAQ